ncbi:MAG: cyclophilin-like fold protein [Thermoplasmata archaeon]|jgi:hypothetical protein|nr:cyclophilin-like fold protein [Thermoplasmata archaeon]
MKHRMLLRFAERTQFMIETRDDETDTVTGLLESLPFESAVNRWGEEIYFDAPFSSPLEADARAEMDVGEVAFWPTGNALAIFFGPTPASTGPRPRAYSECNLVGRVLENASELTGIAPGTSVRIERA